MTAKNITNLRPPEQDFEQNKPVEPWLRQKGEPAAWYMRFQRYLDKGKKRSLRALVAAESGTQVNTKEGKKLSDVSVPRAWRRASKLWRWVERAECYDMAQTEKQAEQMRAMAVSVPHASKAYRIARLDYLARLIMDQIKPGIELRWCLAAIASYQSLMRDIAKEMADVDEATMNACDASAMGTIKQEMAQKEQGKKKNTSRDNSDIDQLIAMLEKSGRLD